MKSRRQNKILRILTEQNVETQEDLLELLQIEGHQVTQATISRDIKELQLVKIPNGQGGYKYSTQRIITPGDPNGRARRIFEDCVKSVDFNEPFIFIKTFPGSAHAVAAIIDELEWPEMIGSIAGDDSILILSAASEPKPDKPKGAAGVLFTRIQELVKE